MRQRRLRIEWEDAGITMLKYGCDFFRQFQGEAGKRTLQVLWERHKVQLLAQSADGTRPMAYLWWGVRSDLRLAYPETLLPTAQRLMLLRAGLLHGAELETARRKIEEWKASARPMAFFDFCP